MKAGLAPAPPSDAQLLTISVVSACGDVSTFRGQDPNQTIAQIKTAVAESIGIVTESQRMYATNDTREAEVVSLELSDDIVLSAVCALTSDEELLLELTVLQGIAILRAVDEDSVLSCAHIVELDFSSIESSTDGTDGPSDFFFGQSAAKRYLSKQLCPKQLCPKHLLCPSVIRGAS
jgi:hypothetical protein